MEDKNAGYVEMMKLWRETARTIAQLSTAGLVLPTFFLRDVLGVPQEQALRSHLSAWLVAAWACFLTSIAFGVTYEITAARLIGDAYSKTVSRPLYPNYQFWALASSLFAGVVCFLVAFVRGD